MSSRLGDYAEHLATQTTDVDATWTWNEMEKERLRGLNTAIHFDKLSAVHNELRAGEVLGEVRGLLVAFVLLTAIIDITPTYHGCTMCRDLAI